VLLADPTDDEIREHLERLDVDRDGEGFAIFEREPLTFVQVSGNKTLGFDMEYQEGAANKHYRTQRENFTLDEVVRAMREYRDGCIDWSAYGMFPTVARQDARAVSRAEVLSTGAVGETGDAPRESRSEAPASPRCSRAPEVRTWRRRWAGEPVAAPGAR